MHCYSVIDAHCDTASELLDRGESLFENTCHVSLSNMSSYRSYIQFFAAWVSKKEADAFSRAKDILTYIKREIERNAGEMEEIHTAEEAEAVLLRHKCGAFLALEDGRSLCGSLDNLQFFYDMGVRAITLAWNDDNDITDGILSGRGAGLTSFGKLVVQEMNRLHMMIDVSHISERGFWDVMRLSAVPVMASHSNCRALCGHVRNLTDAQIKALIEKKGFIGINLYPDFLTDKKEATLDDVLLHIRHILALGGEDVVGFGSDFDGVDRLPKEIQNAADYANLPTKMHAVGFSDALIDKITHKNMINFIQRIEKRK